MMVERLIIALALMVALLAIYQVVQSRHKARASAQVALVSDEVSRQPSLLYFWSEHCAPCVTQAQFLQQLPQQMMRHIHFERIDAEKEHETAARYGVFTLPTTMLVDRRGSVKHVNYGLIDARKLTSQLESIL